MVSSAILYAIFPLVPPLTILGPGCQTPYQANLSLFCRSVMQSDAEHSLCAMCAEVSSIMRLTSASLAKDSCNQQTSSSVLLMCDVS
jgi:hypothetical protein